MGDAVAGSAQPTTGAAGEAAVLPKVDKEAASGVNFWILAIQIAGLYMLWRQYQRISEKGAAAKAGASLPFAQDGGLPPFTGTSASPSISPFPVDMDASLEDDVVVAEGESVVLSTPTPSPALDFFGMGAMMQATKDVLEGNRKVPQSVQAYETARRRNLAVAREIGAPLSALWPSSQAFEVLVYLSTSPPPLDSFEEEEE